MTEEKQMDQLIAKYHSAQSRNDTGNNLSPIIPHTDHLRGVESILSTALRLFGECRDPQLKEDMCSAALGHELLELTEVTEPEILSASNPRVLALIKEITAPTEDNCTKQYMLQLSSASEEARLIKYADLIENTASVCYRLQIVGSEWAYEYFRPIGNQMIPALGDTAFPTYPKTAAFLRHTLALYADLLRAKQANSSRQYPVKVTQFCREAIPEAELERHIERAKAELAYIVGRYHRGMMTSDEETNCLNNAFDQGFHRFLSMKHLTRLTNESSWSRLLEDHRLWQGGSDPASPAGEPWLVYDDGAEASIPDKRSFFRLMDTYLVPIEYFKPIPDHCIRPNRHFNMYGTGISGSVVFSLTDDGGLASDTQPVGKTFTLTDELGLKAVVKILRMATAEDNNNNRFVAAYIGEGTIEGYTSARVRSISISRIRGRTVFFYLCIENDDLKVYYDCPLWQEYHSFNAERLRTCDKHIQALKSHYG